LGVSASVAFRFDDVVDDDGGGALLAPWFDDEPVGALDAVGLPGVDVVEVGEAGEGVQDDDRRRL
jgi:hypothetical protein